MPQVRRPGLAAADAQRNVFLQFCDVARAPSVNDIMCAIPSWISSTWPRHSPENAHDHFQIVLVTRGHGVHVVDWDELPVREGAIYSLAPACVHFWRFGAAHPLNVPASLVHAPIAGFVLNFDSAFVVSCASHETEKVLLPALYEGLPSAFYVDANSYAHCSRRSRRWSANMNSTSSAAPAHSRRTFSFCSCSSRGIVRPSDPLGNLHTRRCSCAIFVP